MLNFQVDQEKCIGCGLCAADCPMAIIAMEQGLPVIAAENGDRCIRCLHCFAICESGAIAIHGSRVEESLSLDGDLPTPEQMELLIKARRAIRNYRRENLEPAVIDRLLEVTGHAPSGRNDRRLLFTVVDDGKVLEGLRDEAIAALTVLAEENRFPAGMEFFSDIVETWRTQKIDILFRGAPHLLIVSAPYDCAAPLPDAVIALTTFELFAQSLGVGTVWNGLAKITIADLVPALRQRLGIPDDHLVGYVMGFGIPAIRYARTAVRKAPKINRVR